MKIYDICEQVFTGNANWYDFGVGMGAIFMLVGLKELKQRSAAYPSCADSKIIWFLGTAKAAITTILMMIVALCVETPEQIKNFLHGCTSGGRDANFTGPEPENSCTTLTLTKISNVTFPDFGPPSFGFSYDFCNNGDYDSAARYPDDFDAASINISEDEDEKDNYDYLR